jgi:hypothetical protein
MIMRSRITISTMLIALAFYSAGCGTEGEDERFQELERLQEQAQAIDIRSNPEAALSAHQELLDAISGFLAEYPNGQRAGELRERREKLLAKLNSLREEYFEYQRVKILQLAESDPQLPSDCAKMVKLWDGYIARFPNSVFTGLARESKRRWESRQQEEMKRGFYIIFDEGEVNRVKGSSHGLMAGHSWDPQFFEAQAAPDPYVVIELGKNVKDYCPVVKDSFHPVWHRKVDVMGVSDEEELTITMRERDVAEKSIILLLGPSLFTFNGIAAATNVLKQDNDDNIGRWSGSIRELLEASKNGPIQMGDSGRLRIKVIRP